MNPQTLEHRIQETNKAIHALLQEIRQMKSPESVPSLEEVIRSIEEDLPEEIDLDDTVADIRDRRWPA